MATSKRLLLTLTGTLLGTAWLVGCDKKEEAAPVAAPVAAKAVDPMEGIAAMLDSKVQFPDKITPSSPELAQAIAALANAIAKGDASKAEAVLEPADRVVLKDLVEFGDWANQTKGIEAVRVCVLVEGDDKQSCKLGLGVQDSLGAYMLAWTGANGGSAWTFSGMAIQPLTAVRVAMLDGAEMIAPTIAAAAVEKVIAPPPKSTDTPSSNDSTDTGGDGPPPKKDPFEKPRPT